MQGTQNLNALEEIVRQSVYRQLGLDKSPAATAPNKLLVNISARHCHLTQEAVEILFGEGHQLTPKKWLYQDGQYAAEEAVTLIGPRSRIISNLRILGPCRNINQVEIAYTDARALGFDVPVRQSGDIEGTPGCMLMGPKGYFKLDKGVIRAAIHVHMSPEDAAHYGVKDKDFMQLKVHGECGLTFDKVFVRVNPDFKLEVHLDTDEGNACGLDENTICELKKIK
ncbi:phosphate propanoyltransferase [Pelagicoccus sp. SDUM812005]|uniref:phosphate propanoyltransferase n=1 Tax=Pelagicoccus sp. SDUM812005 TaxID=3041257 RepID=UPI00280E6229|nr:phosphate propanoyltransferase [Pelagicoccus sp. SDUM812005]MDQ8180029.1 phosphate propanoyltransferase [Pelagicoccus sp. SDUM812005]